MRSARFLAPLLSTVLLAAMGSAATALSPSPSAASTLTSYDLGEVTIEQPEMDASTRFAQMPVQVQGLLAVPAGDGPFPVLLFLHGSYPFCTAPAVDEEVDPYPCPTEADLRQFEGFGELASAWADRGYVTIVPDVSAEYTNGFGFSSFGVRAIQIADLHLDALAAGTGLPAGAAHKADLDRLVLAGHSRGGPLAVRYLTDERAGHPALALVLLTPAYLAPEAVIPDTMPTLLVTSECDGDVGLDGPRGYHREQLPWLRPAPTLLQLIPGGTHNAFSTKLQPDIAFECSEGQLIDPQEQRDLAAVLVPDFLDLALDFAAR